MNDVKKRAAFLSGAPRVSTHEASVSSGARAHILGVISGLKVNGWEVDEFIYGDMLGHKLRTSELYNPNKRTVLKRIAADIVRIALSFLNGIRASKKIGKPAFVYERLGAFQILGYYFKRKGVPWVIETNSLLFKEADSDRKSIFLVGICRYFEKICYEKSDLIVAVTDELKTMVIDEFGINGEKIIIVPNGVDTQRFDPSVTKPIKIADGKVTIGFIGNLIPWAGIDLLIEAVSGIQNRENLCVAVVGDGQCRAAWEKQAREKSVEDVFHFLGRKPWNEIPSFIGGFDVCYSGQINTSSSGMYHSPLKIYEYLAMGKPVIASGYQDANKLIEDGFNGIKFSPGSADELRSSLLAFLEEKERFAKNAPLIRKSIVESQSWDSRVKSILYSLNLTN